MLRRAKSIMIFSVALWGFVGALHNVIDWDGTLAAVGAATSMITIPDGSQSWQATSNTFVIWFGALLILGAEVDYRGNVYSWVYPYVESAKCKQYGIQCCKTNRINRMCGGDNYVIRRFYYYC
ncbi:hypothetical protein GCM10027170_20050 [Aliiglaciecola aliphaticivorans]